MHIMIMAGVSALSVAIAVPAVAATELLANGSFETGHYDNWVSFGDTSYASIAFGMYFELPTDGRFQALLGPPHAIGGIEQTVVSTATTYIVSFDLGNALGTYSSVDFGGTNLLFGIGDQRFTHYRFRVAAAPNPTLSFSFYDRVGYYTLDDVSVTAAPEPASWALMIAGFGLVGVTLRRRIPAPA